MRDVCWERDRASHTRSLALPSSSQHFAAYSRGHKGVLDPLLLPCKKQQERQQGLFPRANFADIKLNPRSFSKVLFYPIICDDNHQFCCLRGRFKRRVNKRQRWRCAITSRFWTGAECPSSPSQAARPSCPEAFRNHTAPSKQGGFPFVFSRRLPWPGKLVTDI